MAKKETNWSDFQADDSYLNNDENEELEEGQEESEDESEEEEDEDQPLNKKKGIKKKPTEVEETEVKPGKKKVKPPVEEEEEEEEEEIPAEIEQEEEEEEETEETVDEPDPIRFFEAVSKITGQPVTVDYQQVDPSSVEGFALREKAIREQTLDNFLGELEQNFPVVFKALQHANNGGDVADLFKTTTSRDYTKVDLKEGDDATAKEILREYYRSRGVKNEAKISKMIETDEDSEGGLITEARSALAEMAQEQSEASDRVLEEQRLKDNERKKRDQVLITAIDDVLEARKLGTFMIPDKVEAGEFRKFVMANVRRSADNKYELITQLDQGNLEQQLQYQYFIFKKGDLSKVIQQKAATENAQKLKLRIQGEQLKPKKSSSDQISKIGSLKDFNNI